MDDTDLKLVALLRQDARAALSDLALHLGVSRATVRARIDRLLARGDILGFTVVTKGDAQLAPVRGLMNLGIEGRGTERIARQLGGLPQVQAIHTTNGRWDMIVEIWSDSLEEFDGVLHRIRTFDGVSTSETSLLLSTRKGA